VRSYYLGTCAGLRDSEGQISTFCLLRVSNIPNGGLFLLVLFCVQSSKSEKVIESFHLAFSNGESVCFRFVRLSPPFLGATRLPRASRFAHPSRLISSPFKILKKVLQALKAAEAGPKLGPGQTVLAGVAFLIS
jgi:hypothetical protein